MLKILNHTYKLTMEVFHSKKKTNERNTFTYLIDVNWEQCTHKYCQILIQISSFFIQRVDISKVRILFNKNLFKYIFDKKTNHFNPQSSFLNLLYVTLIIKYLNRANIHFSW